MGTGAWTNFVPATAHRIEGAPFSHDTLNIDEVVNASADKLRRKEEQWLTVHVSSAKLENGPLSLNLWRFCKLFEEDIEIPATHKSAKRAGIVTVDAGDLRSSQSDPQGNSIQKEPLQDAAFTTELSIPSFLNTALGPR